MKMFLIKIYVSFSACTLDASDKDVLSGCCVFVSGHNCLEAKGQHYFYLSLRDAIS